MTLDQQIAEAAEAYKSGQVPSRAALAKVKRLIKRKVMSLELARGLAVDEEDAPSCP